MKAIDISWPITEAIVEYGGRDITTLKSHGNETIVTLVNHTGTHIDGPAYFFKDAKTIDQFPIDYCVGTCQILDLQQVSSGISRDDVAASDISAEAEIVVCKTRNSKLPSEGEFHRDFVYLAESGADYLAQRNIRAVGIDYVALETTVGFPSHKILLKKEILIIEGLRLQSVDPGMYHLVCLQ